MRKKTGARVAIKPHKLNWLDEIKKASPWTSQRAAGAFTLSLSYGAMANSSNRFLGAPFSIGRPAPLKVIIRDGVDRPRFTSGRCGSADVKKSVGARAGRSLGAKAYTSGFETNSLIAH